MSLKTMLLPACLSGTLLFAADLHAATGMISGQITNDTTWSGTNVVQGTVVIAPGVVVNVEPGTRFLMQAGATLRVHGRLLADGTSNAPIHFTREVAGQRWGRLLFLQADDSLLRHCVIEYSDCQGDHKDYYATDCGPPPVFSFPRNYFQAVVAVASHLDIEWCLFQNLPDGGSSAQGDAIAIISDDRDYPGDATANIRHCRFVNIGQGVHTRYSCVLVENCFFTGHRGDNDDIDLYGESIPPSFIRNNMLVNPASDDLFNPTRCSAIIVGNVFAGAPDAGVVLRDIGSPVMINNLVYNCNRYGVSMQNRCDAVLINNTIVNCGEGIEFRDHETRRVAPYCLVPGSGRATIINCIVWDCPLPLNLKNSSWPEDRGSHARVSYSDVEGGQSAATVSANSTLTWGSGNINANPQFVNLAGNDFQLESGSPCIDFGSNVISVTITITNLHGVVTNWTVTVSNDFARVPRPLDGDGNGTPIFDIGAYEFLLPDADSNGDGIPDGWTWQYGLNPADPNVASENPDNDPQTTGEEWGADTDPTDPLSYFRIQDIAIGPPLTVSFQSSSNRQYSLLCSTNLVGGNGWSPVAGQTNVPGNGGLDSLGDANPTALQKFYQIGVSLP